MHQYLRANKLVNGVILSPGAQRHRLRDRANEYFDAFQNGLDGEAAFDGRIRNLDVAMRLAEQAKQVRSLRGETK